MRAAHFRLPLAPHAAPFSTAVPAGSPPPRMPESASRRDVAIDWTRCDFSHGHEGGRVTSHFFNALSLFFPLGEKFFVHSVRHYRRAIRDPRLARDVTVFIGQEAMHSREHREYVEAMRTQGHDPDACDVRLLDRPLEDVTPEERLAITAAMEHFTAALSRSMLLTPNFEQAPELRKLWVWHACEELEHKSVAFDVFREQIGGGWRGYRMRCVAAVTASRLFLPQLLANHARLLQADTGWSLLRCRWAAFRHAWLLPGVLLRLLPDFLRWFRPGFDPADDDDRALLARIQADPLLRPVFAHDDSRVSGS